ncbi:hypothetical protein OsJ_13543 [Oryza sativa Japonica Group]|uniref:Uncharacterized protein n=1 Tax=Oryza sativa subsp. japonica TaxID=39947 RepID=A3AQ80_ORYSJ|nr:hypothetical protein OsJ_13543 [Oryza sativa Japonica Group]
METTRRRESIWRRESKASSMAGLVLAGAVDDAGVVHVDGDVEGVHRDVLHEAELLVEIVDPHEADLNASDGND